MKKLHYSAFLIVSFFFLPYTFAANNPANQVGYYVNKYGRVSPDEDPGASLAHRVFDRVSSVADKNKKYLIPELFVLREPANRWASALPDGNIVLWRQAIEVCEEQVRAVEACLAFILGHELVHLAKDHVQDAEIRKFLAANENVAKDGDSRASDQMPNQLEATADDRGFVYAAIAGYDVRALIPKKGADGEFFDHWVGRTKANSSSYPAAKQRSDALIKRLSDISHNLGLFEFGVRLSHFNDCGNAKRFFHRFQQIFPSREVLNNLGYCYLQLARKKMGPEFAEFYWLPLHLDSETIAATQTRRNQFPLKTLKQAAEHDGNRSFKEAVDNLNKAVVHLKWAADADESHIPTIINLAVANLYLGYPSLAHGELKKARKFAPDDINLKALEALALYESSEVDNDQWPTAKDRLRKLADDPRAPLSVKFNLARLLQVRPRESEARKYWNQLAQVAQQLPDRIRAIVCREQRVLDFTDCELIKFNKTSKLKQWPWPLPYGHREPSPAERKLLFDWEVTEFDWREKWRNARFYRNQDGSAEVLEIAGFLKMQVIRGQGLGSVKSLQAYCNNPIHDRTLAQGALWTCKKNWAALTFENNVREVWWLQ